MHRHAVDPPSQETEPASDTTSLISIGMVAWRFRHLILVTLSGGILAGVISGLASPRVFRSEFTFVPSSSTSTSSLALAASQLGLPLPSNGAGWGAGTYVRLLESAGFLQTLAFDSIIVGDSYRSVASLLDVSGNNRLVIQDGVGRRLAKIVDVTELTGIGGVSVAVHTRSPQVSAGIARLLLSSLNTAMINLQRQTASAEYAFIESQTDVAERALRTAEDDLQLFLQRNRSFANSPELQFEADRLQREVAMRQQLHTSLLQMKEEARLREIRSTPTVAILEHPRLAVNPESRRLAVRAVVGALAGAMLAIIVILITGQLRLAFNTGANKQESFANWIDTTAPRLAQRFRR